MAEQVADKRAPSRTDEIRAKNREVLDEMQECYPGLIRWAARLARRGANLMDAAELSSGDDSLGRVFRIRLFTRTHRYSINARVPCGDDDGYLGCTASARTPLAGEEHTRGNDLPDGPYCEEMWNEIVHGILGYELVRLGK